MAGPLAMISASNWLQRCSASARVLSTALVYAASLLSQWFVM
jgi:hypothetical protein